jgi:hypothetical protein
MKKRKQKRKDVITSVDFEEQQEFWNRRFKSIDEEAETEERNRFSGTEYELTSYFLSKEDMW